MMKTISIFFLVFFLLITSCGKQKPTQIPTHAIVLSCMVCTSCVKTNLEFVLQHHIDEKYNVILDSVCYSYHYEALLPLIRQINFNQKPMIEIEKEYGTFSNFVLIDSIGQRIEFRNEMHLKDYITYL